MLFELQQATEQLSTQIKPALEQLREVDCPKNIKQFLEMKQNLLTSYCTFISFYLLMKVEGKATDKHPVIYKLAHIKKLFDTLAPVNQKIMKAVEVLTRPVKKIILEEQESENEEVSDEEMNEDKISEDENGSYGSQDELNEDQIKQLQLIA